MNDTIASISTSLGVGAISIIRVSGSNAIEINSTIFKVKNLKSISDDFTITSTEEGNDYTSEKLGIDFYFNNENCLEAVLFMSKEYYQNEI